MNTLRARLLVLAAVVAVAVASLLDPIAQDPRYHAFADDRAGAGLPNVANVASNLPFVLVGALGLWRARRAARSRLPLLVFFGGVFLTGFGSAWYHLAPDNARLVWDRLPLGASCMALLCVVIDRRLGVVPARRLLVPFVLFGLGSVAWWAWGDMRGVGDLRAYGLAQFFPVLGIVVLLWPLPQQGAPGAAGGPAARTAGVAGDEEAAGAADVSGRPDGLTAILCRMLLFYVAAKLAEHWDGEVYEVGLVVSGHTLKHLFAAAAAASLLPLAAPRAPSTEAPAGLSASARRR